MAGQVKRKYGRFKEVAQILLSPLLTCNKLLVVSGNEGGGQKMFMVIGNQFKLLHLKHIYTAPTDLVERIHF